jgi:hypothetical protein
MNKLSLGLAVAFLAVAAPASAHVCLDSRDIQSHYSPDPKTILFHMRNGTVWRNTLVAPCPGLRFNGFSWVVGGTGDICENQQTIRVIRSGELCFLGKFEKEPSPKPKG